MIYQAFGLDKKTPRTQFSVFFGLPERIRTFGLQSRSLTRYPAVPRADATVLLYYKNPPKTTVWEKSLKIFCARFIVLHFSFGCVSIYTEKFTIIYNTL